ncbi:hypothetical protein GCM10009839_76870 [Catenulispora yoronensis]|uniref:Uncharacterized protein n=1 Tax=Catenulispora yoronensis TaxID=450799 RepID=A0ABP5GVI3_9ACTN
MGGDAAVEAATTEAATTGAVATEAATDAATGAAATEAFLAALRAARTALREVPGKLEGARVHDFAFGRLFEAAEVRDAYHQRLPETEKDIAEACEVLDHFIGGLAAGHAIDARSGHVPAPGRPAPRAWTADSFPWCRPLPDQDERAEP